MKRLIGTLLVAGAGLATWVVLVAARCPGSCPFCK